MQYIGLTLVTIQLIWTAVKLFTNITITDLWLFLF